jgi:Tfp pilus assembly protein PilE
MRSVTIRLVKGFMSVILISVIMFIGVLSIFIKQYYYNNVEDIIINQVKASEDFYIRYFSDVSLYDNILDNVDVFWKQTTAQVQIIDPSGHVLM